MIFLSGEIHSSKNSRRIIPTRSKKRPFVLIKSAASKSDEESFAMQLNAQRPHWECMTAGCKYPLRLSFRLIRASHRPFDYANIVQGVQDALVKADYLPDDSMIYLLPVFLPYMVDKTRPGCEIEIGDE